VGIAAASPCLAQPDPTELEGPLLTDHVRLTSPEDFLKAGEAYFSPDGSRIVFQAVPKPDDGAEPSPHYQMFIADLRRDAEGRVIGIGEPVRVSTTDSASTCGWFSPDGKSLIFGSTVEPPAQPKAPGYQRSGSRYAWQFPANMDIVRIPIDQGSAHAATINDPARLVSRRGYDAECSVSPDGRFLLYAHADPPDRGPPDADIWIHDLETGRDHSIVVAEGYDGGPFFSPDARWICYRSDREGDDRLQIYVAELEFDSEGVPVGIEREIQITDNDHVNWAPYFHPSGELLVYTSSALGHFNYEILAVELPEPGSEGEASPAELDHRRITFAPGFDGLPAFSRDGSLMMWTSQRLGEGDPDRGERSGSSQMWVARVAPPPEGAGSDPTSRWTEALAREQAIAMVRDHPAVAEMGARRYDARRVGRSWLVTPVGLGSMPTFRVDPLGRVAEVSNSGS